MSHGLELLIRPDLGYKPHRMRARFQVDAFPESQSGDYLAVVAWQGYLQKAKLECGERFVTDMAKQGWEYAPNLCPVPHPHEGVCSKGIYGATGPFPVAMALKTLHRPPPRFDAKAMLPRAIAGEPMRLSHDTAVSDVPLLATSEKWEYEIAAVFVHKTILTETPDPHEEAEVLKLR